MVRVLASYQYGLDSIPGLDFICGLSLLLVLVPPPRGFLWVVRFSSLLKNQIFQIPCGMLERLNVSPWLGRLVTAPHAIECKYNLIIYLILIDLNSPGYQNCNVAPKANTSLFLTSSEPCPVRPFDINSCRNTLADHYQRSARVPTSVWSSRCTVDIHEIYTRLSWVKQEQSQQNPPGNAQSKLKHHTDIFTQNRYCNSSSFFLTLRDTKLYLYGPGPRD